MHWCLIWLWTLIIDLYALFGLGVVEGKEWEWFNLSYLDVFQGRRERDLEGLGGILRTSNPIIFNSSKLKRFGGGAKKNNCITN